MDVSDGFRVSACMVVKNEGARLRRALDSMVGLIDELVVVDTGSEDDTIEQVAAFGDRNPSVAIVLHYSPWQADFSLHRNEAFDRATGDWIFILDGDEHLVDSSAVVLRRVIPQLRPDTDAVLVTVETIGDNNLRQRFLAQRILRRGVYRYALPVHNQLIPNHSPAVEAHTPNGLIASYYTGTMGDKAKRSLPMLHALYDADEKEVWARYGFDGRPPHVPSTRAHAAFFLTKTYAAIQDHRAVCEWGAIAESLVGPNPAFAELWCWIFYSHLALSALAPQEQARAYHAKAKDEALERGQRLHPHFLDLHSCRVANGLLSWANSANVPDAHVYARISASGLQKLHNIPQASELLGIPIGWRLGGRASADVPDVLPFVEVAPPEDP